MKRNIGIFCLLLSLCLITCGGKTQLEITITEHPVGGENISELSCTFEGRLINGTTPITATIEWWWTYGSTAQKECQHREEHTFDSQKSEEVTTTLSAPPGYVFNDYFWVEISWQDEDGTEQKVESHQVRCTYHP
ncbi:MAG TPA: hypothetical protein ENI34_05740 [candidate division WOR-3 bacterium]|uniref:Uncharacterized protein n=1 Tax=candidate division WOR-3 bacterium TaxID=2052148 RepID=A0A9C9K075_UNCW3|nr:hypothetical protein [candidate division WOR-3 bacterium]